MCAVDGSGAAVTAVEYDGGENGCRGADGNAVVADGGANDVVAAAGAGECTVEVSAVVAAVVVGEHVAAAFVCGDGGCEEDVVCV